MSDMICKCLEMAAQVGLSSIAFPTVGCGRLGYRPEVIASCFSHAVQSSKTPLSVIILLSCQKKLKLIYIDWMFKNLSFIIGYKMKYWAMQSDLSDGHCESQRCNSFLPITLSVSDWLKKLFTVSVRLSTKLVIKWSLKIPPHLKRVATLPCKIFGIYVTHSGQLSGFVCHCVHVHVGALLFFVN